MLRSLAGGERLALWSCQLLPCIQLGKHSSICWNRKTNTRRGSLLGENTGKVFLWCCDKRPPQTSHSLFRRAESVPSKRKPCVLSEYILIHFHPQTRTHKAIKRVSGKRTCRKVIKCKVLWRTAGLLQGHGLIYCLTGWWAGEAGGYWPCLQAEHERDYSL